MPAAMLESCMALTRRSSRRGQNWWCTFAWMFCLGTLDASWTIGGRKIHAWRNTATFHPQNYHSNTSKKVSKKPCQLSISSPQNSDSNIWTQVEDRTWYNSSIWLPQFPTNLVLHKLFVRFWILFCLVVSKTVTSILLDFCSFIRVFHPL